MKLQDLLAMSAAQIDAATHRATLEDQLDVWRAIATETCAPICAGATDPLGLCDCVCDGAYHGRLWIRNFEDFLGP